MTSHELLSQVAHEFGIDTEYTDIWGNSHKISAGALSKLIEAIGVTVHDDKGLLDVVSHVRSERWSTVLPNVIVVKHKHAAPLNVELNIDARHRDNAFAWQIQQESGIKQTGNFIPSRLALLTEQTLGNITYYRYKLPIEQTLEVGYHHLRISNKTTGKDYASTLIVAPDRCYIPSQINEGIRVWGMSLQVYALRSLRNWGIGDFTDLANVVDSAASLGASLVGCSPLHASFPNNPQNVSPYSPSSRLFINVLYLDIEAIAEFIECEKAQHLVYSDAFKQRLRILRDAELVDYVGVSKAKLEVLEILYAHFIEYHLQRRTQRARQFNRFSEEQGEALAQHALFEALQEHFVHLDPSVWGWPAWPTAFQNPRSSEVDKFTRQHMERINFFKYLQWQAALQLEQAASRTNANEMIVGIYKDLALGSARGGAEVWSNQSAYILNANSGAPPDELSLQGQNWGLPPFNPIGLRNLAYKPFIDVLRQNMRHAGAVRIDHVMSLMRLFCIPDGFGADQGAYIYYSLDDLLGILALESTRNKCVVIGEDLGTVPDGFRPKLQELGILSYRLFVFERDANGSLVAPDKYLPLALVGTGTHDMPTIKSYWQGIDLSTRHALNLFPNEDIRQKQILERAQMRATILLALDHEKLLPEGMNVDPISVPEMTPALLQAIHRYLARTPSIIMLAQLEDFAGPPGQMNLPGTTDEHPNWRRKLEQPLEEIFKNQALNTTLKSIREERGPHSLTLRKKYNATKIPDSTYRLQFHRNFTFKDATALIPYLSDLGISHIYASPYLKARPGSTHGYDIIDHHSFNPEIGTAEDYARLVSALKRHNMSQILDMVPNHMGVGSDNKWWLDVLENGQSSFYAEYFDIDWNSLKEELKGKVLLPILGDHYGAVLDKGELKLEFDAGTGEFSVWYYSNRLPIDPKQYANILNSKLSDAAGLDIENPLLLELESLINAFRLLPGVNEISQKKRTIRNRDKQIHKQTLASLYSKSPAVQQHIDRTVESINGKPDDAHSFDALHHLLETQAYRLAFWRVATDEINYRRFFDINDLAALRMERPQVFNETHRFIFGLLVNGDIEGLRIDHPDGLHDPAQYYRRLQQGGLVPETKTNDEEEILTDEKLIYVVVEKILAVHEQLPSDWPIHGSSGYEFANLVNGLFIDGHAERALSRTYSNFIGERLDFNDVLYTSKILIMKSALASEVNVLTNQLNRISEADRHTRDYTLTGLRSALMEVIAHFPVYRTYVRNDQVSNDDRRYIEWAIGAAKKRSTLVDDISVFDFIARVLLTEDLHTKRRALRNAIVNFSMKFQQVSSPVMAKGLEDTSFYRYNRLTSLNDVGGDPRRFGVSIAAFHHTNQQRAAHWPHTLLGTSTHDSKRSEDVRARINTLSEIPNEWEARVIRWNRLNRSKKVRLDNKSSPTRNDEYLLYQTLVGVWPLQDPSGSELDILITRLDAYMLKAIKEAKVNSSWIKPNIEYEQALSHFIKEILSTSSNNLFLADFIDFNKSVSRFGLLNSLAQVTLKFTSPGVPDVYQGNEIWEFSLVDPDNRRPVDYATRRQLLSRIKQEIKAQNRMQFLREIVANLEDGRAKLFLSWTMLNFRKHHSKQFCGGGYIPLTTGGTHAEHIFAFARKFENWVCIVAVPRLLLRLSRQSKEEVVLSSIWDGTYVEIPSELQNYSYQNIITHEEIRIETDEDKGVLSATKLFMNFPLAVLCNEP